MFKLKPIATTTVNLTSGVVSTVAWSNFTGDEFGDMVTVATDDSSGANSLRLRHNGDGTLAAFSSFGAGSIHPCFAFDCDVAPLMGENIRSTDLLQSSGGALSVTLTKWRRT